MVLIFFWIYILKFILFLKNKFVNTFYKLEISFDFSSFIYYTTVPIKSNDYANGIKFSNSVLEPYAFSLHYSIIILIFSPLVAGLTILIFSKLITCEKMIIINMFWISISVISLFIHFSQIFWNHKIIFIKLHDFLYINDLNVSLDFLIDDFTFVMLFIVTFITYMVVNFSCWYMKGDPNFSKFVSFINLFSFFMLVLVSSNNLILVFVGWEGIGMFSYLLINFWSTRLSANRSALKALVVNKIGDCFFYIYIFLYFFIFESFNLYDVKLLVSSYSNDSNFLFSDGLICILVFFLIIACMAKSAQIILHVWLPDAMEGPTPVSSLLHAATMVTAGIYVLIKFNWLIFFNESVYSFVILVGILTNILASFTAMFQFDIKKIIAYSTASQLGFIFISYGALKFNLALFHIFNHSFFKALLFILAGVLIHKLNSGQDLRNMFFFKSNIFFIYSTFFIASLTLVGFPFLSAFFSKDFVIQSSFINIFINGDWLLFFLCVSVSTTIIYSIKIASFLFYSSEINTFKIKEKIKNKLLNFEDIFLTFVTFTLSFFSVFIGYFTFVYFHNDFLNFSSNLISNIYLERINVEGYLEFSFIIIIFVMSFAINSFLLEKIIINYNLYFTKVSNFFFFFNKKTLFDTLFYFVTKCFLVTLNLIPTLLDKIVIERFIILFVKCKNNFIKKMKNLYMALKWWWYIIFLFQILGNIIFIIILPKALFFMFMFFFLLNISAKIGDIIYKWFKK